VNHSSSVSANYKPRTVQGNFDGSLNFMILLFLVCLLMGMVLPTAGCVYV